MHTPACSQCKYAVPRAETNSHIWCHRYPMISAQVAFHWCGEYAPKVKPLDAAVPSCPRCDGCGKLADTEQKEPWTQWTSMPLHSSMAVLSGIVKPIPCPDCGGSGKLRPSNPI